MRAITTGLVLMLATAGAMAAGESFDTFPAGSKLGDHADWFADVGATSGPTVTAGEGVAGSTGLSNSGDIFHWTSRPFSWTTGVAVGQTVVVGLDFQTDSSGRLDDDRVGWMLKNDSDGSDFIFGVQADPGGEGVGGNMECYWDSSSFGDNGGRTSIADLPALNGSAWYRMQVGFTKLTDTSCQIDASFWSLDAAGAVDQLLANGGIVDTSALAVGKPLNDYFTGLAAYGNQMWPAYKNHSGRAGYADNASFEIVPEPASLSLLALGALALVRRRKR